MLERWGDALLTSVGLRVFVAMASLTWVVSVSAAVVKGTDSSVADVASAGPVESRALGGSADGGSADGGDDGAGAHGGSADGNESALQTSTTSTTRVEATTTSVVATTTTSRTPTTAPGSSTTSTTAATTTTTAPTTARIRFVNNYGEAVDFSVNDTKRRVAAGATTAYVDVHETRGDRDTIAISVASAPTCGDTRSFDVQPGSTYGVIAQTTPGACPGRADGPTLDFEPVDSSTG